LGIYAEMPGDSAFVVPKGKRLAPRYAEFLEEDRNRIVKAASAHATDGKAHQVAVIYEEILELVSDRSRIPDSLFRDQTYSAQAGFDDWGRGYRPDPYLLDAEGNRVPEKAAPSDFARAAASSREAVVLIDRMATRTQAIAAIQALSAQGEALHLKSDETGEPSHFDRFLEIYQEFETIQDEGWSPSRNVALNPTSIESEAMGNKGIFIECDTTRRFAELFNLRYRMLLTWLAHSFRLARTGPAGVPNLRAMVMHKVFQEMYNLKDLKHDHLCGVVELGDSVSASQ
jgi:hypothetical protein